jgi:hypothetical protein
MEDSVGKFSTRLGEKAQLLDRFAQATVNIKDALESKESGRIAMHLRERQAIVDKINSVDRQLDELNVRSLDLTEKSNEPIRCHVEQIRISLERLFKLDQDCMALASAEFDSVRSDILDIRSGFRVARSYGRTHIKTPKFLDLKR